MSRRSALSSSFRSALCSAVQERERSMVVISHELIAAVTACPALFSHVRHRSISTNIIIHTYARTPPSSVNLSHGTHITFLSDLRHVTALTLFSSLSFEPFTICCNPCTLLHTCPHHLIVGTLGFFYPSTRSPLFASSPLATTPTGPPPPVPLCFLCAYCAACRARHRARYAPARHQSCPAGVRR